MKQPYILISKTIFFPSSGILAVGDLHLGYEQMLYNEGITLPFDQLKTTKQELEEIINKINKNNKIKKIIFLGDIKHHFGFEKTEKFELMDFLEFLTRYIPKENLTMIRGNHDKIEINGINYKNYYIEDDIAFTHGDKLYPEILDEKIKTIVISHIHPAVLISDRIRVKKEKFKCFLIGKFKKKDLIIVPSFLPLILGAEINENYSNKPGFSIVSQKQIKEFKTYVIGEDNKVYEFKKYKDLL
ncbi:MAG TPA: metallophosphoesterase [Candidatus Nanoarchaeia archaeon]|nr:metallophosphoesterase [Candidatus Nanoarchaeia archaeon]